MGAPMARNLAKSGFRVSAWNRSVEKARRLETSGVEVVESAAAAAGSADAVVLMLSDGPTCDHVLFETGEHGGPVLDAMAPGSLVVVMSSIPVETARNQAARCADAGIGFIDAPVSGGENGAIEATLAIMAGGSVADFERMEPAFRTMGRPTRVGEAGAGQLAKLANQMIVGNTLATIAEALIFAEKGGADPASVRSALLGGFADSTLLQQHGLRMCEGNWEPGGFSRYQLKDLRTAMAFAKTRGLDLPVSAMVTALYEDTVAAGHGDKDQSAVFLELKDRNKT